jgi:hypothetical protein
MAVIGWVLAVAGLGLACCDPMDRPPQPPPKPTDPTTALAERAPADVLDASIVTDGGTGWDGAGFELDTGATPNRDPATERVTGVTRAHFVATGHAP